MAKLSGRNREARRRAARRRQSQGPPIFDGLGDAARQIGGGLLDMVTRPIEPGGIEQGLLAASAAPFPQSRDEARQALEGAAMVPTGVGDAAQLGLLGMNLMDPDFRSRLLEFPAAEQRETSEPRFTPSGRRRPDASRAGISDGLLGRINPEQVSVLEAALPLIPGITAFHGSPHRFDRFDLKKIGSGEGAQAYGHGLYFAENPDVAKSYSPRDFDTEEVLLGRYQNAVDSGDYAAAEVYERAMLHETPTELRRFADDAIDEYDSDYADAIQNAVDEVSPLLEGSNTNLYTVDIPDSKIEQMIDWDSPPQEGSELFNRLMALAEDHPSIDVDDMRDALGVSEGYLGQPVSGGEIYGLVSDSVGSSEAASQILAEYDIPGIRYFDAGSRNSAGERTRNFVVFDDSIVTTLKRE